MTRYRKGDLIWDPVSDKIGTVISTKKREVQEKFGPWGMLTTHIMIRVELEILWNDGTIGTKTGREVEKLK